VDLPLDVGSFEL